MYYMLVGGCYQFYHHVSCKAKWCHVMGETAMLEYQDRGMWGGILVVVSCQGNYIN